MIYYNETVSVPFSGFILQRKVNISILAGNDNITLSLIDSNAVQSDFSIPAGQKMQQRDFDLFRFTIQGSGLAAVALSYPEIIDPSIQVSLNPNVPQSITTPQLPSQLDSNGLLKTRYLGSTDAPDIATNQSSPITTQGNLITGMAVYAMNKNFDSGICSTCFDGIQFDIAAGDMIEILEILIMISRQPIFALINTSAQSNHIPQDNISNEDYYFLTFLSNTEVYLGANEEFLYTDGTYTAPIYNSSTAGAYILAASNIAGGSVIIRPKSRVIYGGSSGFTFTYGLGTATGAPNSSIFAALVIKYRGAATVSFITSTAATVISQYQAGGGKVL